MWVHHSCVAVLHTYVVIGDLLDKKLAAATANVVLHKHRLVVKKKKKRKKEAVKRLDL